MMNKEAENKLVYRVYEGIVIGEKIPFLFCVSNVREHSLKQEIDSGERKMSCSWNVIFETGNRNEARTMANDTEF
ncbi:MULTISPECIES: hypothetical protein [Bacillus]|uniref:Uncharacterized protein n=2 Tax=Bacillus thuringiensis TaxID=1428 RepID=A0AAP4Q732_BACTU|nr:MULTISPECIES: hypothetical protein [Bacillus]AFV21975.1 hypothetical protein BTB_502p06700 [Bacillus thuringiensis Bt407]EEM25003.1 hypothetical protein bthur0002_56450 [Bacillus thuringiensis Bt407]ERI00847.1 hypothetical protein BTCBT_002402 [Bacillus thuringiensis T01-328]MBN6707623.1 hypothetical protein [Bacillus thuringiensis]MDF9599457.1 hypothetical protein [Bacillus cereus]